VLTIFSVLKPFEGRIAAIQRNAIRSWTSLDACQVILCGNDHGSAAVVSEFGLEHIPDVRRNEFGTPLLSSVFRRAEERATYDLLCFVNGDLLLFPDFLDAVRRVAAARTRFLVVGETTNFDVAGEVAQDAELDALRRNALTAGTVRGREWIDFFVFPRGTVDRLPHFAVGRPYWDNWMIWRARSSRIPVVDVSPSAVVVHQEHGYGHVQHATGRRWEGPEAESNFRLVGAPELVFSLDDATHRLTATGLVRNDRGGFKRLVGTELRLHRRTIPLYRVLRAAYGRSRRAFSRA
jgi:hypothetical protein